MRIEFTDTKIETAHVFRLLLYFAENLSLPVMADFDLTEDYLRHFTRKWGCTILFRCLVQKAVEKDSMPPLQRFEICCQLEDISNFYVLFNSRMPPSKEDPWWDDPDGKFSYPFDPRGWSLRFHQEHEIPPKYLFALQTAFWAQQDTGQNLYLEFQKAFDAMASS